MFLCVSDTPVGSYLAVGEHNCIFREHPQASSHYVFLCVYLQKPFFFEQRVCVSRFTHMCESHWAFSLRRAPFYPLLFSYSKAAVLVSIFVPTYSLKTNMSSLAARHRLHVYTSVCRVCSHKHNSPPVMDLKAVFHFTCFMSHTAA